MKNLTKIKLILFMIGIILLVGCKPQSQCPNLKEEGFKQAGFCDTSSEGILFCIEVGQQNECCVLEENNCPDTLKNRLRELSVTQS